MVASIFTDVEVEFIKNNYISMDTSEIASILGKTKKQIKGNAFQMSWGGFANYQNWNSYLYKNANICLDRKNDKFEDAINTKEYIRDIAYYHRNVVV